MGFTNPDFTLHWDNCPPIPKNQPFPLLLTETLPLLIMPPTAQKYSFIAAHALHQTVLLIDAPRVGIDLAL